LLRRRPLRRVESVAGFLFDPTRIGLADVAIATRFRNLGFARQRVDAARCPVTTSFVDRVLAQPVFTKLQPFEDRQARTPGAMIPIGPRAGPERARKCC
jgi:hypothetical protein